MDKKVLVTYASKYGATAEIAGKMYRGLYDHSYFADRAPVKATSGNAVGAPQ